MTSRERPLDDIRVLDLTQFLSGPFATTILADLGADVLKIVRPGDSPSENGALTREQAFDWATNRDKRSLALDLRSEEGRDDFLELVRLAAMSPIGTPQRHGATSGSSFGPVMSIDPLAACAVRS